MRVLPGAFQTKPGAALARRQGRLPWQGRGQFPAPCLGRHPGVRELPSDHLAPADDREHVLVLAFAQRRHSLLLPKVGDGYLVERGRIRERRGGR